MKEKIKCPIYEKGEEATLYLGAVLCSKQHCPYGIKLGGVIDPEQGNTLSNEPKLRICKSKGMLENLIKEIK